MKTLTIVLAAASIAVAPAAFAQSANSAGRDAATTMTAALAPANASPSSKKWKVGDRVPGAFTASSRYKADVEALNLPKAPALHRWIHVEDNAYLINEQTDQIVQITGVSAKS
jgi:Ni/Co efflux regulator RcnB